MTVIRHPNNQGVTLSQWRKTAAGGETSVSGTDDFSAGLAYTAGAEQVFVNGVLLERGVDYTASTGTTVTGLTALVAGDIVTVSSPSAFNVANAIPKATITAKGDLLVGTGASTPANLAVGADGTTLVADSSTSTGLRYQSNFAAGKNAIINGDCRVAQRGSTVTNAGTGYFYGAVDRFQGYSYANNTCTVSQQAFTAGTAPVAGYEAPSFIRIASTSTATFLSYRVEDARAFAGTTTTISFWAKSASSQTMQIGASQNFGSGGSATVSILAPTNVAITTSWAKYSVTFSVASISGKTVGTGSYVVFEFVGAASNNLDLWGVQWEQGSVATAFQTATGTLQGELAACQRYYQRFNASSVYTFFCNGNAYSTTQATTILPLPVTLRTAPSSIETTGTASNYRLTNGATATACNSVPALDQAATQSLAINFYVASGLTAGQAINAGANNTASAYIGVSAEL